MGKKKKRSLAVPLPGRENPSGTRSTGPAQLTRASWQINLACALLVVALVISGYLAWGALTGGALAGCGPESGCDKVLQSRWAYWLGIPVSVPAFLVYLALVVLTLNAGENLPAARRITAWQTIAALSAVLIGAALWFIGLQAFVVKSFCVFCMTAHASGLIAATLLLRQARVSLRQAEATLPRGGAKQLPHSGLRLGLAGALGLAVLVSGQTLVSKARYRVGALQDKTALESSKPAVSLPRILELHGGQHRLNVKELPIMGSPDAPYVMVSLFDYTCHHCRDMHELLLQARQRFSNELAIVALPMPLDAACNHLMKRTPSAHANACEYARLGLAVWRAKPEAFAEFDSWVFHPPSPLPVAEVRQHAEQSAGKEKLAQALSDGWVAQQLKTDIAIYESNMREMKSGQMPQLIVGSAISLGPVGQIENLYRLLAENLGLKATR